MTVTVANNVIKMTADNDARSSVEGMRVSKILWTGGAEADQCVVQDVDGVTIFDHIGGDNEQLEFTENYDPPKNVGTTITAETLDLGTLYIFLM